MTAICKTIPVHGKQHLNQLIDYGEDSEKTSLLQNDLEHVMEYAANPEKTLAGIVLDEGEQELLVSGVLCTPETAALEFSDVREKYVAWHGTEGYSAFDYLDKRTGKVRNVEKQPVTAIHLIQSFSETDIDPLIAHQIGVDLAERLGVQALVCTHVNKDHIHNHIPINAYLPDGNGKFLDNKENRMKIRELSDQIQREYGLEIGLAPPKRQRVMSKEKTGSLNYGEWSAKGSGNSWKDQMRLDIREAAGQCEDRSELIQAMGSLGYHVERETANSITWGCPNGKKIRDTTLGSEYAAGILFDPVAQQEIQMRRQREQEALRKPSAILKQSALIDISIYTVTGRRRTNLELAIRKAIHTLQLIRRRLQQIGKDFSHQIQLLDEKIQLLEQSVQLAEKYGIEDIHSLDTKINDIGIKLNQLKCTVNENDTIYQPYYSHLARLLSNYYQTKYTAESIQCWPDGKMPDLMLPPFDELKTFARRAALSPMTRAQKRALYVALQEHPDFSLVGNFDDVGALDAKDCIDFLNGKSDACPPLIKPRLEASMMLAYERRDAAMKEKKTGQLQHWQKKELQKILADHGYPKIDVGTLTTYDYTNIRNCYDPVPFTDPLLTPEDVRMLLDTLDTHGLSLCSIRQNTYVTQKEANEIYSYIDSLTSGRNRKKPAILTEDHEQPDQMALDKLRMYLDMKHISISLPLNVLTKKDYFCIHESVISIGHVPDCVQKEQATSHVAMNTALYMDFLYSQNPRAKDPMQEITPAKADAMAAYREAAIALMELGYDAEHLNELGDVLKTFKSNKAMAESNLNQKKTEYHELRNLRQQYRRTQTHEFIYDPHYADILRNNDLQKEEHATSAKSKKDLGKER